MANAAQHSEALYRVLILTADAGFGHRSAANAIAAALAEIAGPNCVTDIVNPLEDKRVPIIVRIGETDYDRIAREMRSLYRLGYEASDTPVGTVMIENALAAMLFEVMFDLIQNYQPHAIVTTYPLYQSALNAVYILTNRHIPLLTVVTDLTDVQRLWFHPVADLCLVPTPQARDLAVSYGLDPAKVRITGIPVHPALAQQDKPVDELRRELGWRTDQVTALAVGSKRVANLLEVLHLLNHAGFPLQLVVVAGGDEQLYQHLLNVEWHLTTHIYPYVPCLANFMHAADLIICKAGGLIVTEAMACGLPLLLIDVLPGQEVGNARYVIEVGAGELAQTPEEALEILCHWLVDGGKLLAERTLNSERAGRPHAAYHVAELVWAAAQQGPYTHAYSGAARSLVIAILKQAGVSWRRRVVPQRRQRAQTVAE